MIQLFHVSKVYGSPPTQAQALTDVSFAIPKGGFVFLTGPSGAGKTTLLRLLFGAEPPSHGQIIINGQSLKRLNHHTVALLRRDLGIVFQDFKLLIRRTVEDNVALALEVLGQPRVQVRERVFRILRELGLAHKLNQYPPMLSGGEQQRVALARALVHDPQVLLADEPTGNLDQEQAQAVLQLLQSTNARGTTLLIATHDEALLRHTGKRVLRLEHGHLAFDSEPPLHR